LTAVHLINRSPSSSLSMSKTPYELWFGHKPNVSRFRIFGSKVFCHIPKEKRTKLDVKSQVGFLVGYGINGYRVWDPVHRKIIVARDVVIEELMSNRRLEESTFDQERMLPEQVSETNRNIEFTVRHLEDFGDYLNT